MHRQQLRSSNTGIIANLDVMADDLLKHFEGSAASVWYHGTPDERTWGHGAAYGIHVGTEEAARQALNARIGKPLEGEWDGTREYGKTLLSPYQATGTERDLEKAVYPSGRATYSTGASVPMDARPNVFPVRITGPMVNHHHAPVEDDYANSRMHAQITRGNARRGYYYTNVGEDEGSVSAVVPSAAHLERIGHTAAARHGRGEKTCLCCQGNGSHPDGSECDPCDESGLLHSNEEQRYCPGQPQPRRRHWRQPEGSLPGDDYGYEHRPLPDAQPFHEGAGLGRSSDLTHYRRGEDSDQDEAMGQLRSAQGNPDHPVRIYRAAPHKSGGMINTGDWVTTAHGYARDMADDRNYHDPDSLLTDPKTPPERFHVYEATVPARHLRGAGTLMEHGYWGDPIQGEHSDRCGQDDGLEVSASADAEPSNDYKDVLDHFEAALDDYRMTHGAPNPAAGHKPLYHYTGEDPDDRVRIYRAAPAGTEAINSGDWVSRNPAYAHRHGYGEGPGGSDWPVYTAEVHQKHVHWDENDEDEHGYNGPEIWHPDVHDEETGELHDWDSYHDAHPHGREAWIGSAVHMPQADHDFVHDPYEDEEDRANRLLGHAHAQGALHAAHWRGDDYDAKDDAVERARQTEAPEGHRVTMFHGHRKDDGRLADLSVKEYSPAEDEPWRGGWRMIDTEETYPGYSHQALDEAGRGREATAPDRWYHATNEELPDGAQVLPAAQVGRGTRGGPGDENHAWVSNDPIRAGAYGANIYEVTPSATPRHTRGPDDEHQVPSATVVRKVPYAEARTLSPSYQAGAAAYEQQRALQAEAAAEYRQPHQGPDAHDGEALHELGTRGFFPDDVHDKSGDYGADGDTSEKMRKSRGDPDARITMYRAMPSPHHKINTGDWVTLSKEYALGHAEEPESDDNYAVLKHVTRARFLRNDGNDLSEWTYHGPTVHFPSIADRGGKNGGWRNRKALSDAQWSDVPPTEDIEAEHRRFGIEHTAVADEAEPAVTFRTSKGKRQGIAHTTVNAYVGDSKVGYARMIDQGRTLDDLYVHPDHRGGGLGHALMGEVVRQFGHNPLHLYASPFTRGRKDKGGLDNDQLQSFYSQHGFTPVEGGGRNMVREPEAEPRTATLDSPERQRRFGMVIVAAGDPRKKRTAKTAVVAKPVASAPRSLGEVLATANDAVGGLWLPETPSDWGELLDGFPGFFGALADGLDLLGGRLDDCPVDEHLPSIARSMASACRTAADDATEINERVRTSFMGGLNG